MKRKCCLVGIFSLLSLVVAVMVWPRLLGINAIPEAQGRYLRPNLSGSPVAYYGGPVMPGVVHVYPIYWFPKDNGANDQYISAINQYYQDVGTNRLYQLVANEYAGDNGSIQSAVLADYWEDTTTPYPCQNCPLSKPDIVKEVKLAIAHNGWPASGYTNYFPVYTLQGEQVADPSDDGACGYHWFWGPLDNPTIFAHIVFPSASGSPQTQCPIQVPTAPSGNIYIDSSIDISAHEQMEAATDPVVTRSLGWVGNSEIGDLCEGDFGGSYPFPYDNGLANQAWVNQNGHVDYYIIQTIASRTPLGCRLGP